MAEHTPSLLDLRAALVVEAIDARADLATADEVAPPLRVRDMALLTLGSLGSLGESGWTQRRIKLRTLVERVKMERRDEQTEVREALRG